MALKNPEGLGKVPDTTCPGFLACALESRGLVWGSKEIASRAQTVADP